MACNNQPTGCAPCQDCGTPAAPILPRCQDVALAPGVYPNATVTVSAAGCITLIEAGAADPYTPDPCCAAVGGGGEGEQGLPGPKGDPGTPATVTVGAVNTGAPGTPAQVVNVGTNTAVVLDITIPRGEKGEDGASGTTGIDYSGPDMEVVNGQIQSFGMAWPPVLLVEASATPSGFTLLAAKNDATGVLTLTLDATTYDTQIRSAFQTQLDAQQLEIDSMAQAIQTLTNRLNTCCPPTP